MPTAEPSLPPVAVTARRGPRTAPGGLIDVPAAQWRILHDAAPPADTPARRPGSLRQATASQARRAVARLGFAAVDDSRVTAWQVLGHRQFRRFFLGSVVSNFGTWLQNTAQILLAYRLTHSVFFVGLVTCVQFASPLLFGPWAGVIASRYGSKRTLIVTQAGSGVFAAALAALQFGGLLSTGPLLAGAFLVGLMFTFALPAQSVLIPALVPSAETDTKAAVVMNSVSYNAGRSVAPAFSILLVMTIGFGWAFAFNALSFAVFTLVLRAVRPGPDGAVPAGTSPGRPEPAGSRARDSFSIAWNDRRILVLLLMVAAVTVAEDPILVLGPGLARHLGASDDWSGYFLSALGVGSVLSSLVPRRKAPSVRRAATALGILGVSILAFALAPWIWLSVAAAFAAGLSGLVAGSAAQAKLRELAGPGRALQVMGLWTVAWAGSKPLASLVDGALPGLLHSMQGTGVVMALPALLPIVALLAMPGWVGRLTGPGCQEPATGIPGILSPPAPHRPAAQCQVSGANPAGHPRNADSRPPGLDLA